MKKLLITGATGFIGRKIMLFFLKKGFLVIAQGSSKKSVNELKKFLSISQISSKNVEFWQQCFLETDWDFPNFADIDAIIHCAAATKVREGTIENFEKYFRLNVVVPKILGKKAIDEKINHFIHLSSGQVYGLVSAFPITEETPKNPINLYGITKLIGEMVIKSLGSVGLNYTIVRPFSVYGPGHYNIISIITNKISNNETLTIYGDGTSCRAFSHVHDFCRAVDIILNNKTCFGQDYNLSGIKEYSVNDLVRIISKKLKKTPKIVFKDANVNELGRNIADLSKIEALGFKPINSLDEFIEKEIKNKARFISTRIGGMLPYF